MDQEKKKVVFMLFALVCLTGGVFFLYLGYHFFQDRPLPFWTFTVYITALVGILIFFAFRFFLANPGDGDE
ncbi:MAG: hypothetical protein ACE5HN_08295 [Nitrospiria bacterium]